MLGALAGSAHVLLSADFGQFRRDMRTAEREFLKTTRAMQREASVSGRNIGRGLGVAVLGTVGPLFLLGRALRGSMAELTSMTRENSQTNAVLESTGGIANVTADEITAMAEAMLHLSGVDDQVAQRGLNVLLTFTRIRNEVGQGNDIFTQASSALLDMTFALERGDVTGEAMSASAIRLGRALQDPVRGVTALRRVGVAFTKDQEAMIKRLAETGHVVQAQKILLKELQIEFGGSAEAAGQEFPAALNRMREAAVGAGAAFLETLTPLIVENAEELENWLQKWQDNEAAQEEFRETVEGIFDTLKDLAVFANDVAEALGGWETTIKILIALKFAGIILGWVRAMKAYTAQTKAATFWTGALGAAQLTTGFFAPIPGMKGIPGMGKGVGRAGRMAGTLGRIGAAVLPSTAAVAVGSAIVLSQTPGASGSKEGDRRRQKAALFNGEWGEDYPALTIIAGFVARGDASPRQIALIKSLGEPPWSDGKLASAENRAKRMLGMPKNPPKFPRGRPRPTADDDGLTMPTTELSIGTKTAILQASRTEKDSDDLRALNRAKRELNRLLKQDGLTEEERYEILSDLASVEDDIAQIYDDRQREADDAAKQAEEDRKAREEAAQEARENAHANAVFGATQKVNRAAETKWLGDDLIALRKLLRIQVEWRNQQKKGSDEWRAAQDAVDETTAAIRGVRAQQREAAAERKRARLENQLFEVDRKIERAEETESFADDERWLKRKRAILLKIRAGQKKYSDEWKATTQEIDDVNRAIREGRKKAAGEKDTGDPFAMLNEYLRIQGEYGPNFFQPGGPGTWGTAGMDRATRPNAALKQVVVNQNFTTAPTDYFREARFAQAATAAVFDG